jgi:glycine/D-amino acid oxidase-like deaminating enzyme/nitrite reductase/ring-hydroxylating ferredoxin subunit
MKSEAGRTVTAWSEPKQLAASPLGENLRADVCVVGAGIAGLSTAYMLARLGKKVVVLDDGAPGGGETGRTTAHLSNAIDDRYTEIERLHGQDGARLAAESHSAAIDRIESIVTQERISCEFERVDGWLMVGEGHTEKLLEDEMAAARRAGLTDVEMRDSAPVPGLNTGRALRFPRQATFHPLKYLAGLVRALKSYGGQVYGRTHVTAIESELPARVRTEGGFVVTADAVVVATNSPVNDLITMHTKQSPYRTYALSARVPAGSVPHALFWDTTDPYHYVRLRPGENGESDLLIVGGEDHRTGDSVKAEERWARLEEWARARYPMMGAPEHRWSGQVLETMDGLAYIGRNPMDAPNVYIATGDSGMGMTHGTIAGMVISDLIAGRENAWASLYEPSRVRLGAAVEWLKDNVGAATSYARWLTPGDVSSADEIPRGAGAVIRRGLTKVAVYRDDAGQLHEMSAVCPHAGSIVCWNDAEKTWDCGAHGSRFQCTGEVVNGPANSGLTPIEEAPEGATEASRRR